MVDLISWNMNRRQLWADVSHNDADIALLQEAPRPPATATTIPATDADWSTRGWTREARTCIASRSGNVHLRARALRDPEDDSDLEALGVSRRGSLTVADVHRDDDFLFTAVSAYGAWESPPGSDLIYADASAHRILSDISALITGRRGERLLLAGDLNILHGYGEHNDAYWAARYQSVFDRAAAMGLVFCGPQAPNGRQADPPAPELPDDSLDVPTYHHSRQTPETATRQLDFVFATANIADHVRVRALNGIEEWGPSDHCRIAITVDL